MTVRHQSAGSPVEARWSRLAAAIEAAAAADRTVEFWWRDDDAVGSCDELERLLSIADGRAVALSVIPGRADASLVALLARHDGYAVLQHGWLHVNHAPASAPKSEWPTGRALEPARDDLRMGGKRLRELFGPRYRPILVPPWGRVAPEVVECARELGYLALSLHGPPRRRHALPAVNTSVDLADWAAGGRFIGAGRALDALVARITAGGTEPMESSTIGILTHHRCLDEDGFVFLEELVGFLKEQRFAKWVDVGDLVSRGRALGGQQYVAQ